MFEMNTLVFLFWKIDVIDAGHEGQCMGQHNKESIYSDVLCCSYEINANEYNELNRLNNESNEFFKIFNNDIILHDIQPKLDDFDDSDNQVRNYECVPSENHRLCHKKKKIPIEVNGFSLNHPYNITIRYVSSLSLQSYIRYIQDINTSICESIQELNNNKFPMDIIKLLCRYVHGYGYGY